PTARHIAALIDKQRAANHPFPDAKTRKDRLTRAIALLRENTDAICDTVSADFGHRPANVTKLAGIGQSIGAFKHNRSHLEKWMRPERVRTEAMLSVIGARSKIIRQPKGVVGNIVPWNYPVFLTFTPLASIFAAGNSCIIKPSEFTQRYADLLGTLIEQYFEETEVAVVAGEADVGAAMSSAPFDHLFFTGSGAVGKHVMRACADNLTPVTLELGGKSPAIVSKDVDIEFAATRIMAGKLLNGAQTCVAPDYVLVPHEKIDPLIDACIASAQKQFPIIIADGDYTTLIHDRHFDRMIELIDACGVEPIETHPHTARNRDTRLFPPVILKNPDLSSPVMTEEVFGPILPVIGIEDFDDALRFIRERDHPLALYYFGNDRTEQDRIEQDTSAGGITINDAILHLSQDTLPFGGVGPSGMGHYHGKHGFDEFSHLKSVMHASRSRLGNLHHPPYKTLFKLLLRSRL
ncbi:MAG: coniferyl aldehyde dehydrogenase, partial [Pseudomonadota bacterium]